MDVSKKELIVTIFIDVILLMITIASIYVLKASFASLALATISVIFICVSIIMAWITMREKRIDVEQNND